MSNTTKMTNDEYLEYLYKNAIDIYDCQPYGGFAGSDDTDRHGYFGSANGDDNLFIFKCTKHTQSLPIPYSRIFNLRWFVADCRSNVNCPYDNKKDCVMSLEQLHDRHHIRSALDYNDIVDLTADINKKLGRLRLLLERYFDE